MILGELTDLIAIASVHVGSYFKIKKRSIGWLFSLAAISYFVARSVELSLYSQCFGHFISFSLASYGFWRWRKDESE